MFAPLIRVYVGPVVCYCSSTLSFVCDFGRYCVGYFVAEGVVVQALLDGMEISVVQLGGGAPRGDRPQIRGRGGNFETRAPSAARARSTSADARRAPKSDRPRGPKPGQGNAAPKEPKAARPPKEPKAPKEKQDKPNQAGLDSELDSYFA
jgi:hypothetical protein